MKKFTDKEKLAIAVRILKIYGNMDFWQHRGVCNKLRKMVCGSKLDPKYTSLEARDNIEGKVKNGWEWAEEALKKIEGESN